MADLSVPDSVKMLRETFCVAQTHVGLSGDVRAREHVDRLQRLINDCDQQRPVGADGKHGDCHTETCGCASLADAAWYSRRSTVADIQIPREAVEAGARAIYEGAVAVYGGKMPSWDAVPDMVKHHYREAATAALNAAALPLLAANLGTDSLRDDLARAIVQLDTEDLMARIEQDYGPDAKGCGGWTFDGPPCADCVDCAQMRIAASSTEAFELAKARSETLLKYVRQAIEWRQNRPPQDPT